MVISDDNIFWWNPIWIMFINNLLFYAYLAGFVYLFILFSSLRWFDDRFIGHIIISFWHLIRRNYIIAFAASRRRVLLPCIDDIECLVDYWMLHLSPASAFAWFNCASAIAFASENRKQDKYNKTLFWSKSTHQHVSYLKFRIVHPQPNH
jgi:hypothetical protein